MEKISLPLKSLFYLSFYFIQNVNILTRNEYIIYHNIVCKYTYDLLFEGIRVLCLTAKTEHFLIGNTVQFQSKMVVQSIPDKLIDWFACPMSMMMSHQEYWESIHPLDLRNEVDLGNLGWFYLMYPASWIPNKKKTKVFQNTLT